MGHDDFADPGSGGKPDTGQTTLHFGPPKTSDGRTSWWICFASIATGTFSVLFSTAATRHAWQWRRHGDAWAEHAREEFQFHHRPAAHPRHIIHDRRFRSCRRPSIRAGMVLIRSQLLGRAICGGSAIDRPGLLPGECRSSWLSDAQGNPVWIQPMKVCVNGARAPSTSYAANSSPTLDMRFTIYDLRAAALGWFPSPPRSGRGVRGEVSNLRTLNLKL